MRPSHRSGAHDRVRATGPPGSRMRPHHHHEGAAGDGDEAAVPDPPRRTRRAGDAHRQTDGGQHRHRPPGARPAHRRAFAQEAGRRGRRAAAPRRGCRCPDRRGRCRGCGRRCPSTPPNPAPGRRPPRRGRGVKRRRARRLSSEEHDRPDEVVLLLDGQGPSVLEWAYGLELREVGVTAQQLLPVGEIEQRGHRGRAELGRHHRGAAHPGVQGQRGQHEEQGGEQAPGPAGPERTQGDAAGPRALVGQEARDEEPRQDEEDVDAEPASAEKSEVERHDGGDRHAPEAVERRPVRVPAHRPPCTHLRRPGILTQGYPHRSGLPPAGTASAPRCRAGPG